jgi:hypothetical protein
MAQSPVQQSSWRNLSYSAAFFPCSREMRRYRRTGDGIMLDGQFIDLLVWAALLAIAAFGYVASARAAEKLDRHP